MPSVAEVRRVLAQLRGLVQDAEESMHLDLMQPVNTDAAQRAKRCNDPCEHVSVFEWAFSVMKEQHRKK